MIRWTIWQRFVEDLLFDESILGSFEYSIFELLTYRFVNFSIFWEHNFCSIFVQFLFNFCSISVQFLFNLWSIFDIFDLGPFRSLDLLDLLFWSFKFSSSEHGLGKFLACAGRERWMKSGSVIPVPTFRSFRAVNNDLRSAERERSMESLYKPVILASNSATNCQLINRLTEIGA